MKLEVGKSYRTRNGEKVYILKDYSGYSGDNGICYRSNGRWAMSDSELDLISEWIDEPKYKAGDRVVIELTRAQAEVWNKYTPGFNVVSHTPAPEPEFDWTTVKAGMAFESPSFGLLHYVGFSATKYGGTHVFATGYAGAKDFVSFSKPKLSNITRSPENDV